MKDLQEEAEYQKGDLLDEVRENGRELEFMSEVVKAMLKDNELIKLKMKAKYDENNNKWVLPAFYIK